MENLTPPTPILRNVNDNAPDIAINWKKYRQLISHSHELFMRQKQIDDQSFYFPCATGKVLRKIDHIDLEMVVYAYTGYAKLNNIISARIDDRYDIIWDAELSRPLPSACIELCGILFNNVKVKRYLIEGQNDTPLDFRSLIQAVARQYDVDPSEMMARYSQVRKCYCQIPTFTPPLSISSHLNNATYAAFNEKVIK